MMWKVRTEEIEYDANDLVQSANPYPIQKIDLTVRYDTVETVRICIVLN